MTYAYKESYLYDAMRNLGEMTEYSHDACGIDCDEAFDYLVASGLARRFEVGDPSVVCGMSGTELFREAAIKCGVRREEWPNAIVKYTTEDYYWIGYILALFQWKYNLSFQNITGVIKTSDLLRMYPSLHTVSDDKATDSIMELYRQRTSVV